MITIETAQFIPVTAFNLPYWVHEVMAENASFTYGGNNRSLVLPETVVEHLRDGGVEAELVEPLCSFAREHPGVYLDLEN